MPDTFNIDQGSQIISGDWIDLLSDAKIKIKTKISMDGKGRWIGNRMIERLWRSLKYEYEYLRAFERGSEAKAGTRTWLEYYNAAKVMFGGCSISSKKKGKTAPAYRCLCACQRVAAPKVMLSRTLLPHRAAVAELKRNALRQQPRENLGPSPS